jgi:hypothetical protein
VLQIKVSDKCGGGAVISELVVKLKISNPHWVKDSEGIKVTSNQGSDSLVDCVINSI